jgi:hypothetical protein
VEKGEGRRHMLYINNLNVIGDVVRHHTCVCEMDTYAPPPEMQGHACKCYCGVDLMIGCEADHDCT